MTHIFSKTCGLALFRLLSALTITAACTAYAGEGHDHGDAAPATAGTASPRVHAHSDLFELVGIVDKGQMTVYLDRFATNEPVTGARIEFESGAHKGLAQAQPDGTYLIKFDALSQPGQLPFSFTVTAGTEADLLAGDLDLKDPHDHHETVAARPWLQWLGYTAAVLAALSFITFLSRRFASARRARVNA